MKMKRIIGRKSRRTYEPTAQELKDAEDAMYGAMFRTNPVLIKPGRKKNNPEFEVIDNKKKGVSPRYIKKPMRPVATTKISPKISFGSVKKEGLPPLVLQPTEESLFDQGEEREGIDGDDGLSDLASTPISEFLTNFDASGEDYVCTAYLMPHPIQVSDVTGSLSTSLPEDTFALVESQASLLEDYLHAASLLRTREGDQLLVACLLSIIRNLDAQQSRFRDIFLKDWETCLAASNDFLRMAEKLDALIRSKAKLYSHLDWTEKKGPGITTGVRQATSNLLSQFSKDSVHASHRAISHLMETVRKSDFPSQFFSVEWEDVLTHNEVAKDLTKLFDSFIDEIQNELEYDFLRHKVYGALVRSTVCFYVECFVNKAENLRRDMKRHLTKSKSTQHAFNYPSRAIIRMKHDIEVFKEYFKNLAGDHMALHRVVADQMATLEILLESMRVAVGESDPNCLSEFVLIVHKRTGGDFNVTMNLLSDLWVLSGNTDGRSVVENSIKAMSQDLKCVSNGMQNSPTAPTGKASHLTLDEMLKSFYQERMIQNKSVIIANVNFKDLKESRKVKSRWGLKLKTFG